ncbi:DUF1292 domain-containing protein [Clostridium cylindrosporum]|uniref:UPF0473 protein CLCY_2c00630 n=1 Tax=Clostridium cylindrosporum DSM 605 TaxID=1121307 RepID=A0A0J8DAH0_CLOCY|nr:DUF1292 domain-containing protein [Clostridium cylindrosporum]KMT21303.1 hypothetical protein CLCY_2c00630 [Clostridium cylindrosporum DSM 605]
MEENTNIISLTDEEGVERDFEVITVLNVDNTEYAILYDVEAGDEEDSAVVFRIGKDAEGSDILEVVEDDSEFDKVADVYQEWLDSEDAEDEE